MAQKKKAKPKASKSRKSPSVPRFDDSVIFSNLLKKQVWLDQFKWSEERPTEPHDLVVFSRRDYSEGDFQNLQLSGNDHLKWKKTDSVSEFNSSSGVRVLVRPVSVTDYKEQVGIEPSAYALARELAGESFRRLLYRNVKKAVIDLRLAEEDEALGYLIGLELAHYRFRDRWHTFSTPLQIQVVLKSMDHKKSLLQKAKAMALAINTARHLVNLPPQTLHPVSYAKFVNDLFKKGKNVKVEIWDDKQLLKKGLGLLSAVGQGSVHKPRLVRLSYRPKSSSAKPLYAFVGKGVTFDTGGNDIKPADGMRWMKKDMAGSASVMGLCLWAQELGYDKPFDVYMALAENAVSGESFKPGDVFSSYSGKTVEIHNTDAEGRLVMADAIEVAKDNEPERGLIDVATLTGAIKVALGADIAGLFSNDAKLSELLTASSRKVGEPVWPMPLAQNYRAKMKSTFADMNNAVDGFGGAITAALFLQNFAEPLRWAHLDVYGWRDAASGCYSEMGANGQAIQLLADFLEAESTR